MSAINVMRVMLIFVVQSSLKSCLCSRPKVVELCNERLFSIVSIFLMKSYFLFFYVYRAFVFFYFVTYVILKPT